MRGRTVTVGPLFCSDETQRLEQPWIQLIRRMLTSPQKVCKNNMYPSQCMNPFCV